MSIETSTSRYSWGTHTTYWVDGLKVAFRDTYNDGSSDICDATAMPISEAELAAMLGQAEPKDEPKGHYHDPEGRFDYCDDPACERHTERTS